MINPKDGKKIDQTIAFLVKKYSVSGNNPKPVITHSLHLAFYLLENDYSLDLIQAAILHDLIEDSDTKLSEIKKEFGSKIAKIVSALTFKASIEEKEAQYKELFDRTLKAGKDSLIVKAADVYVNSFYINLVKNKTKEIFLVKKIFYFLNLSKGKISKEIVWKDLKNQARKEKSRVIRKYKVNF